MVHALKLPRRLLLQTLSAGSIAGLCTTLSPGAALAARRAVYGGELTMSLPLNTWRLDPHDPEDLTACLLAPVVFDCVFSQTSAGNAYPTLASRLPQQLGGDCVVELRPHLRFSDGRAVTAASLRDSLLRAQKSHPSLEGLPKLGLVASNKLALRFYGARAESVASLLCHPAAALVAPQFEPTRPVGTGALRIDALGSSLQLSRNALAARGGSYIDQLRIKSGDVVSCLRDFESKRSELCLLGLGLHQDRKDAYAFRLPEVAHVVVLTGRGLQEHATPGRIHSYLEHLPAASMASLGVGGSRQSTAKWAGPPVRIMVEQNEPWLLAIAEQMSQAWTRPGAEVTVLQVSRADFEKHRHAKNFELALTSVAGNLSASEAVRYLYRLDGRAPPRGSAPPLVHAGRQLSLGVLGPLSPRGGYAAAWTPMVSGNRLNLSDVQRKPT